MFIIQPIPDTATIPKSWFCFVSKSQLIDLGEKPTYYPGTHHTNPSNYIPISNTITFTSRHTTLVFYQRSGTVQKPIKNPSSYLYQPTKGIHANQQTTLINFMIAI